jgi:hypothetical protein
MLVRAIKLAALFAVAWFAVVGDGRAATVIISPGGGPYVLDGGNVYAGPYNSLTTAAFVNDYVFSVAASDLPFLTSTTSNVLPSTGGIKSLTVKWFSPSNTLLGTLLVTNGSGNATGNPALVIGLSLLSEVGNYLVRVTGTPTTGGDGYLLRIATTPLPPALLLFGSALAGLGLLGRRRRRATNTLAP